jgi:hypothetical protein
MGFGSSLVIVRAEINASKDNDRQVVGKWVGVWVDVRKHVKLHILHELEVLHGVIFQTTEISISTAVRTRRSRSGCRNSFTNKRRKLRNEEIMHVIM